MTHAGHVEDRLGAYLDAELEAGERAAVESHLHACASCREELAALREVHAALLRAELPEPEARYWGSFATRVDARLASSQPSTTGSWIERLIGWFLPPGRLAWARAAAAVATVTLLAYVGMHGYRSDRLGVEAPIRQPAFEDRDTLSTPPAPRRSSRAETSKESRDRAGLVSDDAPAAGLGTELEAASQPALKGSAPAAGEAPEQAKQENASRSSGAPAPEPAAEEPQSRAKRARTPSVLNAGDARRDAAADALDEKVRPNASAPETTARLAEREPEGKSALQRAVELDALAKRQVPSEEVRHDFAATASVLSDEVHRFVSAALEADAAAAARARERLQRQSPEATAELQFMEAWDQATSPATAIQRQRALGRVTVGGSRSEALRALDALVWPRRDEARFQDQVARLADALQDASTQDPELRPRARAYVGVLLEKATDDAERVRLQQRLDTLAP